MNSVLNILVIEDYDTLRESIVETLTKDGHNVMGVSNAEDVDDEKIGFVPDLYIIDLNLPGEDGISLTARIRKSQPTAKIIIATARTSAEDRVIGYTSGANNYLLKPLVLEEMRAVINNVITQRNQLLAIDSNYDAVIDLVSMEFKGPEGIATLSNDELLLLSAFSRSADYTLEHWQINQQLSLFGEISQKYQEVKLARLRKKITNCGIPKPAIKVIRNYGYKILFRVYIVSKE